MPPGQPPQWPPSGAPGPFYYPAQYGPNPVHRVHGLAIAGLVVGLAVLMTLCALVFLRNTIHALPEPVLPTATPAAIATSTALPTGTATTMPTNTAVAVPTGTATVPPTAAPLDTATAIPTAPPADTATPLSPATATLAADTATPLTFASPTEAALPAPTKAAGHAGGKATATRGGVHIPAPTAVPTSVPVSCSPSSKGKLLKTNTFCVTLVKDFSVIDKGTSYASLKDTVSTGVWGTIYIQAGKLSTPSSVTEWLQSMLSGYQKSYPDVQSCGSQSQVIVDGQTGTLVAICYTVTPQGGSAFAAESELWAATAKQGSSIYSFAINSATDVPQVITDSEKLLSTLHWTF